MKYFKASLGALAFAGVTAFAAGCGGGGGTGGPNPPQNSPGSPATATPSPTPAPTATPTLPPVTLQADTSTVYDATDGAVNGTTGSLGTDNQGTANTATIDGVPCNLTSDKAAYPAGHVHFYVGVVDNGKEYALPAGIGMYQPDTSPSIGSTPTYTAGATQCLFNLHTHDQSGNIHIEYPQPSGSTPSFTLGQFLQIWQASSGMTFSASGGIGNFSGPVSVYVGKAVSQGGGKNAAVTSYGQYIGDPTGIPLSSHIAIWLTVGTLPTKGLPEISFGTEQ